MSVQPQSLPSRSPIHREKQYLLKAGIPIFIIYPNVMKSSMDIGRIKDILRKSVKESLEFISSSNTDLPREEYTDVEIDLNSRKWIAHKRQFINVYATKEKSQWFGLTSVKKFIDILLEYRLANTFAFDKGNKPGGTFIVERERPYLEQNVFLRFPDSYIFRCGLHGV